MSRGPGFRARLLLGAVLPALVMVGLLELIFVGRYHNDIERAFHDRAQAIARQLAASVEYALFTESRPTLDMMAQATRESDPLIRAVGILDRDGQPLSLAGEPLTAPPAPRPALQLVDGEGQITVMVPVQQSTLAIDDEWRLNSHPAPLVTGYVVVEFSRAELQRRQREMLQITLLIMFGGFLFASWLSLRVAAAVTRPIAHISETVARFGRGELDARVRPDAAGVLALLESGINEMADRIAQAQQELQAKIAAATEALRQQKEAAETLARTDVLTGLLNRRAIDELVQHEIQRALRYGASLSVIMADLDHFKVINDRHGHPVGDQVLIDFARILRESVREVDRVGRWGGEEFVILMPGTGLEEARQAAERMRLAVAGTPTRLRQVTCGYTASFGVAEFSAAEASAAALFQRVDAALYRAKERGRNRVEAG